MPRRKKLPNLDLEKIRKIKRGWIEVSFILALIIPFIAGLVIKDWSIYADALSDFGTHPGTAGIWSVYLITLAIGIWLHGMQKIEEAYDGLRAHVLYYILNVSATSLMLTAFITEIFRGLHGFVAGTFFISYMVFIFMYGFWQLKTKLKEGAPSVVAGLLLLFTSLLTIPFQGLAIFEISYVVIIVAWNYLISTKERVERLSNFFTPKCKQKKK
jgi:hypothetical membrane protein